MKCLKTVTSDAGMRLAKEESRGKYLHPVFLEEISTSLNEREAKDCLQIFFLVHGFLGEAADMWMFKDEIQRVSSKYVIY